MRYADAPTQARLDRLERLYGRPLNSPGWGMLIAVKTGGYISERDPTNHITIEAGATRVSRDYWLARERPELFKLADKRDGRTCQEHRGNLERARQDLERGAAPAQLRRSGALPARTTTPTWRLPRREPSTGRAPWRLPR